MIKAVLLAGCVAMFLSSQAAVQEHEHSSTPQLGTVHFATSCNPQAQQQFDEAVALLHSFQFSRAIPIFNETFATDRTCGIAYWGIALSQWSNPFSASLKEKTQLQAGQASAVQAHLVGAKTDRERAYIAAVAKLYTDFEDTPQPARLIAYRDAMREVAAKYPDDTEAQIFYALALSASEDPSDKTYASRLKAGAILEKLFDEQPNHPGLAHYLIHTYDVPGLASKALPAAHRYAEIAPDAPHALHMPSHTFTRTGDWQDSIDSNIAAAAAANRENQTAEELHATDYEMYAYLQTAQDGAALRVLNSLPNIASRLDPNLVIGGAGGLVAGYFALAAIPARYALERQDWKQAAQLMPRETKFGYTEAMTWFARGLGAARLKQAPQARECALALEKIQARLLLSHETYWALQVKIQELTIRAWASYAAGNKEKALRQMVSAAELEDGTEKSAITPGPLAPARELLAEMFLELHQPTPALAQFEATLNKEPRRFRALYGAAHAAKLCRKTAISQKYFAELLNISARAEYPARPEIAEARAAIEWP